VRHGESAANVFDRGGEQPEDGGDRLTEHGWAQARGLGERLRDEGLEAIVASPMGRAQETAAAIGETLDLPVSTDDDLFEVVQSDAYHADRSTRAEHASLAWMPDTPPDKATPGAESFAEITGRISRARARLEAVDAERVLVVSHHDVLHFLLGLIMFEDDFAPGHLPGLYRLRHANTGISIFTYDDERVMDGIPLPGWSLTTWNDRAHL
jgi:ribonuclease H / adenosylcobalamin/alpha-ribazole phosphatase